MKIKILKLVAGPNFIYHPNDKIEVDEKFGRALISAESAVEIEKTPIQKIEKAVIDIPEKRVENEKPKRKYNARTSNKSSD